MDKFGFGIDAVDNRDDDNGHNHNDDGSDIVVAALEMVVVPFRGLPYVRGRSLSAGLPERGGMHAETVSRGRGC